LIDNLQEAKIKVCDFGLSIVHSDKANYGTPSYGAPELRDLSHTNKVDIFSFAVILWELFHTSEAWKECSFSVQITDRIQKGERPAINEWCPVKDLIISCWHQDPNQRPPFEQVYKELNLMRSIVLDSSKKSMRMTFSERVISLTPDKAMKRDNNRNTLAGIDGTS